MSDPTPAPLPTIFDVLAIVDDAIAISRQLHHRRAATAATAAAPTDRLRAAEAELEMGRAALVQVMGGSHVVGIGFQYVHALRIIAGMPPYAPSSTITVDELLIQIDACSHAALAIGLQGLITPYLASASRLILPLAAPDKPQSSHWPLDDDDSMQHIHKVASSEPPKVPPIPSDVARALALEGTIADAGQHRAVAEVSMAARVIAAGFSRVMSDVHEMRHITRTFELADINRLRAAVRELETAMRVRRGIFGGIFLPESPEIERAVKIVIARVRKDTNGDDPLDQKMVRAIRAGVIDAARTALTALAPSVHLDEAPLPPGTRRPAVWPWLRLGDHLFGRFVPADAAAGAGNLELTRYANADRLMVERLVVDSGDVDHLGVWLAEHVGAKLPPLDPAQSLSSVLSPREIVARMIRNVTTNEGAPAGYVRALGNFLSYEDQYQDKRGVIPMYVDDGSVTIVDSIAGGADSTDGEPNRLTLRVTTLRGEERVIAYRRLGAERPEGWRIAGGLGQPGSDAAGLPLVDITPLEGMIGVPFVDVTSPANARAIANSLHRAADDAEHLARQARAAAAASE